jgi:hypothetical protein
MVLLESYYPGQHFLIGSKSAWARAYLELPNPELSNFIISAPVNRFGLSMLVQVFSLDQIRNLPSWEGYYFINEASPHLQSRRLDPHLRM